MIFRKHGGDGDRAASVSFGSSDYRLEPARRERFGLFTPRWCHVLVMEMLLSPTLCAHLIAMLYRDYLKIRSAVPTLFLVLISTVLPGQEPAQVAQKLAGKQVYATVCFACHQPTGAGIPGMFPPLAGSDWVTAKKPDRLIRMVLHGLIGPISVNGKPFATPAPIMPPQGTLTDAQVADVLTYVRAAFGAGTPAVTAAEVGVVRQAEASRSGPWTEAELLKIPVE